MTRNATLLVAGLLTLIWEDMCVAQQPKGNLTLEELAAPNAPAFMLLDVSPANIESPNTPKEFTFAAIQSFAEGQGWPQNFAVQFTPYWWIKPSERSVYEFAGINPAFPSKSKPFSGLKFSSLSVAFVNADLIPDQIDEQQKILSLGLNSTLIKIQQRGYASALNQEIQNWHTAAQEELKIMQEAMEQEPDRAKQKKLQQQLNNSSWPVSAESAEKIRKIINQKPVFSLNIAGAYALYGIDDQRFASGRSGIWTTLASYLPLSKKKEISENYFKILIHSRYMTDRFSLDANSILPAESLDLGAKIGLDFSRFSVAFESINRNYVGINLISGKRNVGLISYRINETLYLNGTFGEDFGPAKKLVSLFGINWGFGDEKVNLNPAN